MPAASSVFKNVRTTNSRVRRRVAGNPRIRSSLAQDPTDKHW